jgi:hypothetical protein
MGLSKKIPNLIFSKQIIFIELLIKTSVSQGFSLIYEAAGSVEKISCSLKPTIITNL